MQNNNYQKGKETLFDERQGPYDEVLFLMERK